MGPPAATSPLVHIDPHDRDGLQTQVYRALRRAILNGTLTPGARLPSSRALADDLDVSRTTTLLAYEQLTAEGYIMARRGAGTFVAHELPDDLPTARLATVRASASHPIISNRGRTLAALPPAALRIAGPPRAFRIGVPAVDRFPAPLWARLVNRRLRSLAPAQLDYSDPAGQRPLRDAIAGHVSAARGTSVTADQIIIVAGAQRGLELLSQALLDPGDDVLMEEPGYPGARSALVAAGAVVRTVRVDDEGIDVEAISRLGARPRLAYVTPSHQFPLGVPMTLPRRLALLRWAREANAWIVEDDYDSEYRYGTRPVPCLHGLSIDGRVLYVGSFSKTLFPALRLGFLIVPADVAPALSCIRRAADLHPPVFEQLVVADLIADGHYDRHLRRMRAVYRERLEALEDAAERRCTGALRLRPVHTGLHAVADLADTIDPDRVLEEAADRGLEVMSLAAYFAGRVPPPPALVLGFGSVDPNTVRRGIEKLAEALDASLVRNTRTRRRTRRP